MTVKLDEAEIVNLKKQLFEANRVSRFVIIQATTKSNKTQTEIVTDYHNYKDIKEANSENFEFQILRDILPITNNLVYWAVAQQKLHQLVEENSPDKDEAIDDLQYYTEKVMEENKVHTAS
ncbi:hypothetical protein [Lentilactobacillus sp. Marseille-Q4993]|uniref:hypothetical protein n=1 Tax=Lentilactobacillus sp. Marseille-Q4993 TaxID=3039492 RepID=UPI0024BD56AE|nr:hypothetical protein [Lentilactobacillus sp. Marseille-Q4993]